MADGCATAGDDVSDRASQLQLLGPLLIVIIACVSFSVSDGVAGGGSNPASWSLLRQTSHWLSGPFPSSLPRVAAWLDVSISEAFVACAYISCVVGALALGGVQAGLLACAKMAGTTTAISLALLVVPATRTSLLVRALGLHYDRAVRVHKLLASMALLGMVRTQREGG